MSKSVEAFVHMRVFSPSGKLACRGGVTIRMIGVPGEFSVGVQVAKCSNEDVYCKGVGRVQAKHAPVKQVPLRYLPSELRDIAGRYSRRHKLDIGLTDYSYTIKTFLPKE